MKIVTTQFWGAGRAFRAGRGGQWSARPALSICHRARKSQGGSAVMVILILLCIMALFIAANTATLNWLRGQVNLVDKRQTQRLASASTNRLHSSQSATNQPVSK